MKRAALACLLASGAAHAQAPPPGQESGRIDHDQPSESPARTFGRTVLFLPRVLLEIALAPVRGAVWPDERYHVTTRAHRLFYNDADTFGMYPMLVFESTEGVLVGGHLVAQVTPDARLHLSGGAGNLGRRRVVGDFRTTGLADGHLTVTLFGDYDRLTQDRFYGIGNADEIETPPPMQLDALNTDIAVKTYYEDTLARGALIGEWRTADSVFIDTGFSIEQRTRGTGSKDPSTNMVFTPESLVAFPKYRAAYGELQLRYDTRRARTEWQPRKLVTAGSLAALYGGPVALGGYDGFWRGGVDLQHYFAVGPNPRVLALRFEAEAVTAATDAVPFTELPALGGHWLRGYPDGRFRDRIAAVGSAEYQWDLASWLFASTFVDAGRVYPSLEDLTLSDLRCGFGFALEAHTYNELIGRVSIATSVDGGVQVNLFLSPMSDVQPRVRRR